MKLISIVILIVTTFFSYHLSANSIDPVENIDIPTGAYSARFVRDIGHITQIEYSGNLEFIPSQMNATYAARAVAAKEFYRTHTDEYDFLIIFSDFNYAAPEHVKAFYLPISNNLEGIGQQIFDNSKVFGSNGRLRGYIDMFNVSNLELNPGDDDYQETLIAMAHEVMHSWVTGVRYKDESGTIRSDLIGQGGAHWSSLLDTNGSVMYGHDWLEGGEGEYTALSKKLAFSPLDLYLSGFYAKNEVPQMALLESDELDASDIYQFGKTISATSNSVSIEQVILAEGARKPNSREAQKKFNAAFVFLTKTSDLPSAKELVGLNNLKSNFEDAFALMTGGRGIISVYSNKFEKQKSIEGDANNLTSVDLDLALDWLEGQQSVLGYWEDRKNTRVKDTAFVTHLLSDLRPAFPSSSSLGWLANIKNLNNVDDAARIVKYNELAMPYIVGQKKLNKGWGLGGQEEQSVIDTAIVLMNAPALANQQVLKYLYDQQNSDGGWPLSKGGISHAATTAQVIKALRALNVLNDSVFDKAADFLASKQTANGSFSIDYLSSVGEAVLIIDALAKVNKLSKIDLSGAIGFLERIQLSNGSWKESVYTTAYVVNVLKDIQLPNLVLDSIEIAQANVMEGDIANIDLEISNGGSVASSKVMVSLYEGGNLLEEKELKSINPNEGLNLNFSYITDGRLGDHRLNILIDKKNTLVEKTKSDNQGFIDISVASAVEGVDLTIDQNMSFLPGSINVLPVAANMQVSIKNLGLASADNATISVLLGDAQQPLNQIYSDTITVAGKSQVLINAPLNIIDSLYSHVYVEVSNSEITDSRLENNTRSIQIPYVIAADYSINTSDITFQPLAPKINEDIIFNVKVRNVGTSSAASTSVTYNVASADDFEELTSYSISLNSGEFVEHQLQWRPTKAGVYHFNAIVDSENLVVEVSETNNQAAAEVSVLPIEGVNLSIHYKDLMVTADELSEGKSSKIELTVVNNGAEVTPPTNLKYFIDSPDNGDNEIGEVLIPSLGIGEDYLAEYTWNSINYSGRKLLYAEVDSENKIIENKESDNLAFIEIDITPRPDLAISDADVVISPALILANETVNVSFTVLNLGGQSIEQFKAELSIGGNKLAEFTGEEILPYSKQVINYTFDAMSQYSEKEISIVLDPANDIAERSESNNLATSYIKVSGGDFYLSEGYISPNGDGIQDQVGIYYNYDQEQPILLQILNASGQAVLTHEPSDRVYSGSLVWKGKDDLGYLVSDGKYSVELRNALTNLLLSRGEVVVDNNRSSVNEAIGTEYGELINVSDKVGHIGEAFYFDNDQKMLFLGDGGELPLGLYVANHDGSASRLITTSISGKILSVVSGLVLIGDEYSNNFDKLKVIRIDTGEVFDFSLIQSNLIRNSFEFIVAYSEAGQNLRVLVYDDSSLDGNSYDTVMLNIPLGNLEGVTILDRISHEYVDWEQRGGFTIPGTPLAYVSRTETPIYADLIAGKIYPLTFRPFNYDTVTKELVGISDQGLVVSDYYGNIKTANNLDLDNVAHIIFDGIRKEAVVYADEGDFWGCGGFGNEQIDENYFNNYLGGSYHISIPNNVKTKITNRAKVFWVECIYKEGIPPYQALPVTKESLLKLDNNYISLFDEDGSYGLLQNGLFIDNGMYILDNNYIKALQYGYPINNKGYDQSTSLITYDLDKISEGVISPLFNNIFVDKVSLTPSNQFLKIKQRIENSRDQNTLLFRSLMNLSVGLGLQVKNDASYIEVKATAADRSFKKYEIHYRLMGDSEWMLMLPSRNKAVVSKVVHSWIPPKEGVYTVRLTAFDKAGNSKQVFSNVSWGRSLAVTNIALDKELFSPNGDGVKDQLSVTYSINRATNLDIRIYAQNGNLVREESLNYSNAVSISEYKWDGRDQFGSSVSDGIYSVSMDGLSFDVVVDNTFPQITDECTKTFIYNDPENRRYFNSEFCFKVNDELIDNISMYTRNNDGDWVYAKSYEVSSDIDNEYFYSVKSALTFAGTEYRLSVKDSAGNISYLDIDEDKKVNYFIFYASSNFEKSVHTKIFVDESPGNTSENIEVNIAIDDEIMLLNNTIATGEVRFEISSNGESWNQININILDLNEPGFSALVFRDLNIIPGQYLRAVQETVNGEIYSNLVHFVDLESENIVDVSLNESDITNITVNVKNGIVGVTDISLFSTEDSRYFTPSNIFSEDLAESTFQLTSQPFQVEPCTSYTVVTKENFNVIDSTVIKTSCMHLTAMYVPNIKAQCGELAESLNISIKLGAKDIGSITSLTVQQVVNGIDLGYVYSNLQPVVNPLELVNKTGAISINSFEFDIKEYKSNDDVQLRISAISDTGEELLKTLKVIIDDQIPVFTNTASTIGERQCAVTIGDNPYFRVKGQIVDYSGNSSLSQGRDVAYAVSSMSFVNRSSTFSLNPSLGLMDPECDKAEVQEATHKYYELCKSYAPNKANLIQTAEGGQIVLQQGLLDYIPVSTPTIDETFHIFDQNGNHSCTNISATIDFEIENLATKIPNLVYKNKTYYLSLLNDGYSEEFIHLTADEELQVVVSINEYVPEQEFGGLIQNVFDGQYIDDILTVPFKNINLEDGRYVIVIKATDACGLYTTHSYPLEIDSTPPIVTLLSPTDQTLHSVVEFFGTIDDKNLEQYQLEFAYTGADKWLELYNSQSKNSLRDEVIYRWNVAALSGDIKYRVKSHDTADNETLVEGVANIDNDVSILSSFDLQNRFISLRADSQATVPLILQVKKPSLIDVMIENVVIFSTSIGSGLTTVQVPKENISKLEDGLYEVQVEVYESSNPGVKENASIKVSIDSTLPIIDRIEHAGLLSGQVSLEWSDLNLESISIQMLNSKSEVVFQDVVYRDDKNIIDLEEIVQSTQQGYYTLDVQAVDKAGNKNILVDNILYDRTVPAFSLIDPISLYINHKNNLLQAEMDLKDDYISRLMITVDDKLVLERVISESSIISENIDLTSFSDGPHNINFSLLDLAGNETQKDYVITLDSTAPAIIQGPEPIKLNGSGEISLEYDEANIDYVAISIGGLEVPKIYRQNTINLEWPNNLADGSYTLSIESKDLAHNTSNDKLTLSRDSLPPLAATNLAYRELQDGEFEIYWSPSVSDDVAGYEIYRDGALLHSTENLAYRDAGLVTGTYEYWVKSTDMVGNLSVRSNSTRVIIDNTAPSISIHSLLDSQEVFGVVPVVLSIPDADLKQYTITIEADGQMVDTLATGSLPVISLVVANFDTQNYNGLVTIAVVAEDVSGNQATNSITVRVNNLAPTPPTISKSLLNNEVTLEVYQPDENASSFDIYRNEVLIDHVDQATLSSWKDQLEVDGMYRYYIVQNSRSGLSSQPSNSVQVFLNLTAPKFEIISPISLSQVELLIELQLNLIDKDINQIDVRMLLSGSNEQVANFSFNEVVEKFELDINGIDYGNYTLEVTARDLSANVTTKSVTINVADITPPSPVQNSKWIAEADKLTINWQFDSSLEVSQGVEQILVGLFDDTNELVASETVASNVRDVSFDVVEGDYRAEIIVSDNNSNVSIVSVVDDIEIIKPKVAIPYTPDVNNEKLISIVANFYGDIWLEKNGTVLETYEVNVGDKIEYQVLLENGVNNYKIYGHYGEHRTLDFDLELINSSVPTTSGEAVFDANLNSITISQNVMENESAYVLVDDNDFFYEATDVLSANDNRLIDKAYSSVIEQDLDVYVAELEFREKSLLSKVDVSHHSDYYLAKSVVVYGWSGMHWVEVASVTGINIGDSVITLAQPYMTNKIKIDFARDEGKRGIGIQEITPVSIMKFPTNIIDTSDLDYTNSDSKVYLTNIHGVISDISLTVRSVEESLLTPNLSAFVDANNVNFYIDNSGDSTSIHIFRNDIDIPALTTVQDTSADTGLKNGEYSYYAISYDDNGKRSPKSNVVEVVISESLPMAPFELSASVNLANVEMLWEGDDQVDWFKVYRKTTLSNSWEVVYEGSDMFYVDSNVHAGTPYMYAVTSLDDLKNESAQSNIVTAIVLDDLPFNPPVIISPQSNVTAAGSVNLIIESAGANYIDIHKNNASVDTLPVSEDFTLVSNVAIRNSISYPMGVEWYVTNDNELMELSSGRLLAKLNSYPTQVTWDDEYVYLVKSYGVEKVDIETGVVSTLDLHTNFYRLYGFTSSSNGDVIAVNTYWPAGLWLYDYAENKGLMIESGDRYYFNYNITALNNVGDKIAYVHQDQLKLSVNSLTGNYESHAIPNFEYDEIMDLYWDADELLVIYLYNSAVYAAKINIKEGIVYRAQINLAGMTLLGRLGDAFYFSGYTQDWDHVIRSYSADLQLNWEKPSKFSSTDLHVGNEGYLCNKVYSALECALLPGYTSVEMALQQESENVFSAFAVTSGARYSKESNKVNVLAENIPFINAKLTGGYKVDDDKTAISVDLIVNMESGDLNNQSVYVSVTSEQGELLFEAESQLGAMTQGDVRIVSERVLVEKDVSYYVSASLTEPDNDSTDNAIFQSAHISSDPNPAIDLTFIDKAVEISAVNLEKFPNLKVELIASSASGDAEYSWSAASHNLFHESLAIKDLGLVGEITLNAQLVNDSTILAQKSLVVSYADAQELMATINTVDIVTSNKLLVEVNVTALTATDYISGSYTLAVKDDQGNLVDSVIGSIVWLEEGGSQIIQYEFDLTAITNGAYKVDFEFSNLAGDTLVSEQRDINKEVFSLDISIANENVSVPIGTTVELPFEVSGELVSYIEDVSVEFVNHDGSLLSEFSITALPFDGVLSLDGLDAVMQFNGVINLKYSVNANQQLNQVGQYQISVLDVTAPVIDQIVPDNGGYLAKNQDVLVSIKDSDGSNTSIDFTINEKSLSLNSQSGLVSIPSSLMKYGSNTLLITAKDEYGNQSDENAYQIIFDDVPPVVNIQSSSSGLYSVDDVAISSTFTDEYLKTVSVTLNDSVISSDEIVLTEDGNYAYMVKAWDEAGNESIQVHRVIIDKTKPELRITGLINGAITNQNIPFQVYVKDDNLETFSFTINGLDSEQVGELSDEGVYSILISATDKAGWSDEVDLLIEIDKTAPAVPTLEEESGFVFESELVALRGYSEPSTIVTLQHVGGETQALVDSDGQFLFEGVALSTGDNDFTVSAIDKAGNISEGNLYTYLMKDPLEVDLNFSMVELPRVLIYSPDSMHSHGHGHEKNHNSEPESSHSELMDALEQSNIEVLSVADHKDLMSHIRSMKYNVLMVDDVNGFNGLIKGLSANESLAVRSYISNGLNLILLNSHPSLLNLWRDVLGVKANSAAFKASGFNVDDGIFGHFSSDKKFLARALQPLSNAYGIGNLTCVSSGRKCRKLGSSPAFVVNKYGLGTTVTFGFNALHEIADTKALIVTILNYVADNDAINFEHQLVQLAASSDSDLDDIIEKLQLELMVDQHAVLNGTDTELVVDAVTSMSALVTRKDLVSTVNMEGSVNVDGLLKSYQQEELFDIVLWNDLLSQTQVSIGEIDVPWFKAFHYWMLLYTVDGISSSCDIESCDVDRTRHELYNTLFIWRLHYSQNTQVLKALGAQLMFLDYVERQQRGAL